MRVKARIMIKEENSKGLLLREKLSFLANNMRAEIHRVKEMRVDDITSRIIQEEINMEENGEKILKIVRNVKNIKDVIRIGRGSEGSRSSLAEANRVISIY